MFGKRQPAAPVAPTEKPLSEASSGATAVLEAPSFQGEEI